MLFQGILCPPHHGILDELHCLKAAMFIISTNWSNIPTQIYYNHKTMRNIYKVFSYIESSNNSCSVTRLKLNGCSKIPWSKWLNRFEPTSWNKEMINEKIRLNEQNSRANSVPLDYKLIMILSSEWNRPELLSSHIVNAFWSTLWWV